MIFGISVLLAIFVLPRPWGLVAVVVGASLDIAETGVFLWWSQRGKASVGVESMVGKRGLVVRDLWPEGQIKINGELWRARYEGGCEVSTEVVVREVEGLTLVVEPAGE
ncbi:MAG TPA: NfeD family protein [Gaiellaceae bacterium]|nr:NfeD family protein [Gaiellaceae bacterium]